MVKGDNIGNDGFFVREFHIDICKEKCQKWLKTSFYAFGCVVTPFPTTI